MDKRRLAHGAGRIESGWNSEGPRPAAENRKNFIADENFGYASSDPFIQSFTVRYDYPVFFTRDMVDPLNTALIDAVSWKGDEEKKRLAIFIDSGVCEKSPEFISGLRDFSTAHRDRIEIADPVEILAGGEGVKNDPQAPARLYREFHRRRLDRHSFVLAVGGGAVIDAVGFACATFHRGLRHIRVPTTVLAQNDAGIGVKNGVNALGVKNLLGSFQAPWAVINDSSFIENLPAREKRAGMAEAVKVALIRDPDFFLWLEANAFELATFSLHHLEVLIRRCAKLHMRQISTGGDPFERGNARPLDFGHWSAHKLESLSGNELRHGEAVAIGIALDARYSYLTGLLPGDSDSRILNLLKKLGFPLWHDGLEKTDSAGNLLLLEGLREFREHLGGRLSVTLLTGIGTGVEVDSIDPGMVVRALDWLRAERTS